MFLNLEYIQTVSQKDELYQIFKIGELQGPDIFSSQHFNRIYFLNRLMSPKQCATFAQ